MRVQLIPVEGGEPRDISRDVTIVGRKSDCDIQIDHKSVSKQHCVLVKTDGLLFIRDLGSTNGTRVNGQRVRRAAVVPNDTLAIAGHQFRVRFIKDGGAGSANELTKPMAALDVAEMAKLGVAEPVESAAARVEIHTSQLPDIYPDDVPSPPS